MNEVKIVETEKVVNSCECGENHYIGDFSRKGKFPKVGERAIKRGEFCNKKNIWFIREYL